MKKEEKSTHRSRYQTNDGWNSSCSACFCRRHNDYVSPMCSWMNSDRCSLKSERQTFTRGRHPHAGIIPTTYFSQWKRHHRDSLNYDFKSAKVISRCSLRSWRYPYGRNHGKNYLTTAAFTMVFNLAEHAVQYKWIEPYRCSEKIKWPNTKAKIFRENCTGRFISNSKIDNIVSGFLLS